LDYLAFMEDPKKYGTEYDLFFNVMWVFKYLNKSVRIIISKKYRRQNNWTARDFYS
jgi:hypothetical protein